MEEKVFEKMKIDTVVATILGLVTLGIYWIVFFRKWLLRNQNYKESYYAIKLEKSDSLVFIQRLRNRTERNMKLSKLTGILLVIGLVIFLIEAYVELFTRSRPLFPEEPFWFYVWLTFSLFALLLGSIALQLRKTMLEEDEQGMGIETPKPWLLSGGGTRIYILTILNIILALGLLPFIIFPPITSSAINGYVDMERKKQTLNKKL